MNIIMKNLVKAFAVGCCVLSMTGAVSAEAKSNEEVKQETLELVFQMANAAEAGDYETFRTFCEESMSEEEARAHFENDWSKFTKKDQHFVTIMASEEPYYMVDVTGSICSGVYPNYSRSSSDSIYLLEDSGEGMIVLGSETEEQKETMERMNALYQEKLPEGAMEAFNNQRNCAQFENCFWWLDEDNVVNGSLDSTIIFLWQDEEANLYMAILVANGTDGNRCFTSVDVTITDDNLGTVFEGNVEDRVIKGSFNLMKGKNDLVICKVPAEEVWTGTQTWGSMHTNVHTNNM